VYKQADRCGMNIGGQPVAPREVNALRSAALFD
jgi:hypothetical protein